MDLHDRRHRLGLHWLLLTLAVGAALFVAWEQGLLATLYASDSSRISWLVSVIYVLASVYAGWRAWLLSAEVDHALRQQRRLRSGLTAGADADDAPATMIDHYVAELEQQGGKHTDATAVSELLKSYEYRLKSPQEIGWLATDVMLKLGLVGTIIGFIMMLGSVSGVEEFDVSTMQNILQLMSTGMGTALYTTLVGISCSLLAGFQYYLLDKGANQILDVMRECARQKTQRVVGLQQAAA